MKKHYSKLSRIIALAFCLIFATSIFAGCSNSGNNADINPQGGENTTDVVAKDDQEPNYATYVDSLAEVTDPDGFYYSIGVNQKTGLYDNSILYRNDMKFPDAPDPGAIYVDGYFYVFHTAAPIKCYRTKNFANWELVSYAFDPADDSWAYGNYWAPEVIQSKTDGKFYMYYNASCKDSIEGVSNPGLVTDRMKLGVAVADKVEGPYKECRNSDNSCVVFDIAKSSKGQQLLSGTSAKVWAAIDASPFYDGNQLYLYFAKSADANYTGNEIWGMRMNSMTEPDYDSLKQITRKCYSKVNGGKYLSYEDGSNINEGPNMIKHTSGNGVTRYYLSFSVFGYTDRRYSVAIAVADSPLGDFEKLDERLMYLEPSFDHVSGTGHCTLLDVDGETYIFYHGHKDVEVPSGTRGVAVDRVIWEYDSNKGYDVMHANGPTRSLQLSPLKPIGYKNLMKEATVSATNIKSGNIEQLSDDFVSIHGDTSANRELVLNEDGGTITITFDSPKQVRGLMVYNSYELLLAFSKIKEIKLIGESKTETIPFINFPKENYDLSSAIIRPGGGAFVEFTEIMVKSIEFTLADKLKATQDTAFSGIALSEIVVIGK